MYLTMICDLKFFSINNSIPNERNFIVHFKITVAMIELGKEIFGLLQGNKISAYLFFSNNTSQRTHYYYKL